MGSRIVLNSLIIRFSKSGRENREWRIIARARPYQYQKISKAKETPPLDALDRVRGCTRLSYQK